MKYLEEEIEEYKKEEETKSALPLLLSIRVKSLHNKTTEIFSNISTINLINVQFFLNPNSAEYCIRNLFSKSLKNLQICYSTHSKEIINITDSTILVLTRNCPNLVSLQLDLTPHLTEKSVHFISDNLKHSLSLLQLRAPSVSASSILYLTQNVKNLKILRLEVPKLGGKKKKKKKKKINLFLQTKKLQWLFQRLMNWKK